MQNIDFTPTQRTLLDAFLDIHLKEGYTAITPQRLAEEAKVSLGTVRYQFSDKDLPIEKAAILYAYEIGRRFIDDKLAAGRTLANFDPIMAYVAAHQEWQRKQNACAALVTHFLYSASFQDPPGIDRSVFVQNVHKRIEALIFESVGRGLYRLSRKPSDLAPLIHLELIGGLLLHRIMRGLKGADDVERLMRETIQLILRT